MGRAHCLLISEICYLAPRPDIEGDEKGGDVTMFISCYLFHYCISLFFFRLGGLPPLVFIPANSERYIICRSISCDGWHGNQHGLLFSQHGVGMAYLWHRSY
jgi:hypothetical protein